MINALQQNIKEIWQIPDIKAVASKSPCKIFCDFAFYK